MRFVASVTISPSELKKILQLWHQSDDPRDPFAHILISPITASKTTFEIVRKLKESGRSEVYFDSGGYTVQQGKLNYEELYSRLKKIYNENQWADWYILPDHVPTSSDSQEEVKTKIKDTVTVAKLFVNELPGKLKPKILPVVQGHTIAQIQYCLENYFELGANYIGFGSFATMGANGNVNRLTRLSSEMLDFIRKTTSGVIDIHIFGITTPPVLSYLHKLGVTSFDSLGWNKSANYGNVYLPFLPALNVSHRNTKQSGISQADFEMLKRETQHDCYFCRNFAQLRSDYMIRRLHNLAALLDTCELAENGSKIPEVTKLYRPNYLKTIFDKTYN